jgi:hypothetical protein
MTGTARGTVSSNGRLDMPVDRQASGTTGMRYSAMKSHNPADVMKCITELSVNYPPYQIDFYDCEDYSFLAAADIRCRFPGQPVAIAIGKATHPTGLAGQMHAVTYLWFEDKTGGQTKWIPLIFDPTIKSRVDGFDPKVIIPLPVSVLNDHKELPPFDDESTFPFLDEAAFELDYNHKFELIPDVMKTLKNKLVKECPKPTNLEWQDLFMNPKYWSFSDRVFYWFAHIRAMHQGAPVGVAFGEATTKKKSQNFEYAALVLWKSANEFIYWDIQTAKNLTELDAKFEPRVVIV